MAYEIYESERGFALGKEHLRTIDQEFKKTLRSLNYAGPQSKIIYVIQKSNQTHYSESDLEKLLVEKLEGDELEQVSVWFRDSMHLDCDLNFSRNGIKLEVEGENKEHVVSLFLPLRECLRDVETMPFTWRRNIRAILVVLALIAIGWSFFLLLSQPGRPAQEIVRSQNILEKLNFLIEERPELSKLIKLPWPLFPALGLLAIILLFNSKAAKICDYLFPEYIFLFGKEVKRHEKREQIHRYLFWAVIVGLIVSVVGSYLVWLLTRS
jgi:hypothetical protein